MKQLEIDVLNKYGEITIDLTRLDKFSNIFQNYLVSQNNKVDLTIVGDEIIQKLNKKYRQKDKVTDVLSFANHEVLEEFPVINKDDFLGEVLMSYPQIQRQSVENKIDLEKEFYLMIIHGVLHLLGYDHIKDEEAVQMEQLEDSLLLELFN